jgi:nucleotide-binding universal stress UspA family protein
MKTCLVVANKTLPGEKLAAAIRARIDERDLAFYIVVPLAPVSHGVVWDEDESGDAARTRLTAFLDALRGQGIEAAGEIGDSDPIQAVRDVLRGRVVDEIILSTLAPGVSRWLQLDVPSRLSRAVDVPVTVITQDAATAASQS